MNRCTDRRIGDKLHAFELGQLPDEERREVMAHLCECEYCFERARKFLTAAQLLRGDDDIAGAIAQMAGGQPEPRGPTETTERWRWPKITRLALAAAVAVVILLLKPWDIEFRATKEAMAYENLLAIMYFDDMTHEGGRQGEIVSDLLINDLAESKFVTVVSSQRLYDILKLSGHEGLKNVPRDIATEVANKAHARWMLTGSILQTEPVMILTSQLVDVQSGNVLATQKVTGNENDDVFVLVDRLTVEMKRDLSLPAEALKEYDPQVRTITTASEEAYRHYLDGMDYYYKYFNTEAAEEFGKAVSLDSTFALAYFRLYLVGFEPDYSIAQAMKYIDNANDLQQRFIRAANEWHHERYTESIEIFEEIARRYPDEKEIYMFLGRIYAAMRERKQAIDAYLRAINIDPLYKQAYNSLVYLYRDNNSYDEALWAINKYIDLAPDEPMPYVTRGILYAYSGQLNNAIASYKKAIEIRPSGYTAYEKLGDMYMFTGDFAAADGVYRKTASLPGQAGETGVKFLQSRIARYRGQFKKALQLLKEKTEMPGGNSGWTHFFRGAIYDIYFDDQKTGLKETLMADSLMQGVSLKIHDLQNMKGAVAINFNNIGDTIRADSVLNIVRQLSEQAEIPQDERYAYFRGRIAFDRGDLDTAIYYLEIAYRLMPRFPEQYDLARAYYKAGRLADAVKAYETALGRYDFLRADWPDWSAEAHYNLGICYEESGWNDRAIEQYGIFLNLWKDADTDLPQIGDARERLDRLQQSP
jgi:tetratricopeptide (TPR) repeat protein/TolB-like protein